MPKKPFYVVLAALVSVVVVFHPGRHARYYDYVVAERVPDELVPENGVEGAPSEHNLRMCPLEFYAQLASKAVEVDVDDVRRRPWNYRQPLLGGEHSPGDCRPIFKTAVVVPYRNRTEHLRIFLDYMHAFLQNQKLHYRIFVVDQNDELPFNRAKMLNYGAHEAIKNDFPCLVLKDVDLLPLTLGNVYACAKRPRHMSSSVDTFRFNLPYLGLFGGAVAIRSEHFKRVNGMSNVFEGWGGEDDDFFKRLKAHDLLPYRFAPEISKYTMLFHGKEKASESRWRVLSDSLERQKIDGLNSIGNYKVILEPLYTHLIV